jgi:hypothetical protein
VVNSYEFPESDLDKMTTNAAINYMERTRLFYRAQGYARDYVWAHFDEVPFVRLKKPLNESKIAVVTTSSPSDWQAGMTKEVWSGAVSDLPSKLFTADLAWDKDNTHTNDAETYLPLRALQGCIRDDQIGGLTQRFHGVPTQYSQRQTLEHDGPEVLRRCREDGADAVLLIPL